MTKWDEAKNFIDCDCPKDGCLMQNDDEGNPRRLTTREFFLGRGFDWGVLCMPTNPLKMYSKGNPRSAPHFFGLNDWLGICTALIVGAQHALAMIGGLIVPPLLIVPFGYKGADEMKRYLIQAALVVTGVMTLVQVTGIRFGKRFMWGPGVLSVMGVSFTSVPIVQSVITKVMADGGTFEEAYGSVLGTLCVSTLTPILLSFLPVNALKKVFPPIVSGVTIILIGIHLTGAGLANWGGGSYCSKIGNYDKLPNPVKCDGNGEVMLPFGDKHYVGLGFLVFVTIILTEMIGSPFMRNCSAIIGLLFGYFISAVSNVNGLRYVNNSKFETAPGITFIWTKTFPLKFYGPAIIPLIVVAVITAIESVGDTAATIEASRMPTHGYDYSLRLKGALFNDGISGVFSALATSLPLTTFAQNNGVIALTNVASRQSGYATAFWLILLGILGKVGAFVVSIPNCVLGGMTTFLFANVISSGIKIIVSEGSLDRRTRFILACSMALGVGVELVPQWGNKWLWPVTATMSSGERGIRDAIALILSTSFCLGAITAFILNLILPAEQEDEGLMAYEESRQVARKNADGSTTSTEDLEVAKADTVPMPEKEMVK